MADYTLLEGIIDRKIEKILQLFLENNDELFHINKVSSKSNVPVSTAFRIVKKLAKIGVLSTVNIGKFKVYKLTKDKRTERLAMLIK
jgi:predicted transcriptional regulator